MIANLKQKVLTFSIQTDKLIVEDLESPLDTEISESGVRCICCYATLVVLVSGHHHIATQSPVSAPTAIGKDCINL